MTRPLLISGILAALLWSNASHLDADLNVHQSYFGCYVECHDAENLAKSGDYLSALAYSQAALKFLEKMHEKYPTWEPAMVLKKTRELQDKITELRPLATKQSTSLSKGPDAYSPYLSTYSLEREAVDLEKSYNYWGAINGFEKRLVLLEIIHQVDPTWESANVKETTKKIERNVDRIIELIVN